MEQRRRETYSGFDFWHIDHCTARHFHTEPFGAGIDRALQVLRGGGLYTHRIAVIDSESECWTVEVERELGAADHFDAGGGEWAVDCHYTFVALLYTQQKAKTESFQSNPTAHNTQHTNTYE
jgi:hypothetical protein